MHFFYFKSKKRRHTEAFPPASVLMGRTENPANVEIPPVRPIRTRKAKSKASSDLVAVPPLSWTKRGKPSTGGPKESPPANDRRGHPPKGRKLSYDTFSRF